MPELWPEGTGWDEHSLAHATTHGVSADEIDEVIANGRAYRAYKRGRSADYLAVGVTDGGRRVVVAVEASAPARRTATPMSTRWTCPSTHFSSLAGQECRGGHRELDRIGTSAAGRTGIWEVQGNVVRDLACLNRVDPRLPVPTHYASFSGQRQP